jgi:hypothetical protein
MEKIIYALWRDPRVERTAFNARLRRETAPLLAELAHAVRINLQDETVAESRSPRMASTRPQMEAVIQVWADSARPAVRKPLDELVGKAASRFEAWLVAEAVEIANTRHPPRPGERTEGFSQVVFLGRPPRLTWEAWRELWQDGHTTVAIETQANFEYVQNLVVRPLTYGAPDYAAIVEECFPEAAMLDEAVYFDAPDAPAKLKTNQTAMDDSCARFIDFDRIDCLPTSQFEIKPLPLQRAS